MDISNAYNKILELEGLLLLLKTGVGDEAKTAAVFKHLFDKIDEIDDEIVALRQEIKAESTKIASSADETMVEVDDEIKVVDDVIEEESDNIGKEIGEELNKEIGEELGEEIGEELDEEVGNNIAEGLNVIAVEIEETAEEISEDLEEIDEDINDEDVADGIETLSDNEDNSEPEIEVEFDCIDAEEVPEIVIDESGVDVNQSAFALKSRGDIRKMFTLNDNYKFRRELFANSQERYVQALTDIERMESMAEAENYFYNTMALDKENAEVKEFMSIVSVYFMGR